MTERDRNDIIRRLMDIAEIVMNSQDSSESSNPWAFSAPLSPIKHNGITYPFGKQIPPTAAILPELQDKQNIDNSIKQNNSKSDFVAATKEDKMPPKYEDGSFRSKKSGLMEYRFMHLDKQISVYGRSEYECFDKRTAIIAGKAKGTNKKQSELFKDWLNKWFELYKMPYNGEKSLQSIKNYIEQYICPTLGNKPLNKLNGIELQEFINKYSDRPNTQRKIADILHAVLEQARKLNKIRQNPFDKKQTVRYKKQTYRALEIAEQTLVYNAIDNKVIKSLFMLCCCTGIRIGRVLELTAGNFDFNAMEITILKKQRKGMNEVYKVPFLPALSDMLNISKEGTVFNSVTYDDVLGYFKVLYKKLKIKKANIHSFRHTFSSVCYYIGIRDKQIQEWMGHNSIKMTMDTYTHLLKASADSPIVTYLKELKASLNI